MLLIGSGIQIQFDVPKEISQVEIYWFDDTGIGERRIPKSWKVFYDEDGKWRQVLKPYELKN
ncbi:MAG: hypothetical protein FJ214_05490 [Ignavibacteria bacterium]|nr:hypothetical protein [Ignavibacteria bacterium]